ncbi:class I SAM-dependent methyltransferase [Pseudomonas sp.]|uniref:class I SAM-dependent methyltransferase n=1 Tax=Pseudomonas sp. TaxID=306 RepID=UPI0028AD3BA8|nr:class I SAM-dependent methyltransferase [Pseudomonas sp.]
MNQSITQPAPDDEARGYDLALLQMGRKLLADDYRFTTVTPLTHQRNNSRAQNAIARDMRDIFGWNRPFDAALLPGAEAAALRQNQVLRAHAGQWISNVRYSRLGERLFVHSGFPTQAADSVFFGPDTYRFAQAIEAHLRTSTHPVRTAADIGCGSGAGAIVIAGARRQAQVQALDINPMALRFTAVNAALAQVDNVPPRYSDLLSGTSGEFDLIVANPPYMQDTQKRAYRHGGDRLGSELAVRIVEQALERLTPGGTLLLYTGTPWVDGTDLFLESAQPLIEKPGFTWSYREVDPDVFGEELESDTYACAERIAAVVLTVTRTC